MNSTIVALFLLSCLQTSIVAGSLLINSYIIAGSPDPSNLHVGADDRVAITFGKEIRIYNADLVSQFFSYWGTNVVERVMETDFPRIPLVMCFNEQHNSNFMDPTKAIERDLIMHDTI